jgi:hypothetical protein
VRKKLLTSGPISADKLQQVRISETTIDLDSETVKNLARKAQG